MLEILDIKKNFVNLDDSVLDGVSLTVAEGEFLSLLGPSGCGKTTLLRIIAGLETADSGRIILNGQDITDFPPQQRPFHMVFQKHALFPHLSVFENVAFGLRIKKWSQAQIREKVQAALELVQLDFFADRYPPTLSGGQSQRVALARALVNEPEVVLLDEPLSALDEKLKKSMQSELRLLQKKVKTTFICVTHDQEEAFALSDRVAVMNRGNFEQVSEPAELYHRPASLFVSQFVGTSLRLPVEKVDELDDGTLSFRFGLHAHLADRSVGTSGFGKAYSVVRPEHVQVSRSFNDEKQANQLDGKLMQKIFRGQQTELMIDLGDELVAQIPVLSKSEMAQTTEGERLFLSYSPLVTTLFWSES
jgi:spermidine/putrescine transport system ATP-binding protein